MVECCLFVERQTPSDVWKRSRRIWTKHKKSLEHILTGCLLVSTIDPCSNSVMPSVNKRCPSQSESAAWRTPRGTSTRVHAQGAEGVLVLLSALSSAALGAVINRETGHAIFRKLEPEIVANSLEAWSKRWFYVGKSKSAGACCSFPFSAHIHFSTNPREQHDPTPISDRHT